MALRYKVITKDDEKELEKAVEKHLNEGWVPCGGICVRKCTVNELFQYHQALTKESQ